MKTEPPTDDPLEQARKKARGKARKDGSADASQDGPGPQARKIIFPLSRFHAFGQDMRPRYVIKGLIPHGGLVVVWGPPKCGKSFWTMDLSLHVALGRPYRNHRVTPGLVVYLALEGEHGFKARRDAFASRFLEPDDDPPFYLMTTQIDLRKQARPLVEDIRAQLDGDKPSLIVVDTLNRSLVGSESKDEDMADYIRAADCIRGAFGCAVLIVHHCGINGERPRGHTSLTGAVDAQLAVRRDDSGLITATVEHMKDGDFGETIGSRLEVVELDPDEDDDPVTSCVVVAADGAEASGARRAKISGASVIALEALREALAESGIRAPASNHIPDNITVVSLKAWREIAYRRGISGSDEEEARKKAFQRALQTLAANRIIGVWDTLAWTV